MGLIDELRKLWGNVCLSVEVCSIPIEISVAS